MIIKQLPYEIYMKKEQVQYPKELRNQSKLPFFNLFTKFLIGLWPRFV